MKITAILAGAALAFAASGANAAVVLFDNFDSSGPGQLNWPGDTVFTSTSAPGSVDLIPVGGDYDIQPGNGFYVDLDGTSGDGNSPSGQLTSVNSFGPGAYTLSFSLAGNGRGAAPQSLNVSLGSFSTTIAGQTSATGFTTFNYAFTTATAGQLVFTESGPSTQQGSLLDNVVLSAAPEPATWSLMIAGVGLAGFALRRRRGAAAALAI